MTILTSAGLRRIEEKPHEAGIHPAKVDKSDQYFRGKPTNEATKDFTMVNYTQFF